MNNRVLVTGGNGTLGQALVPRLLEAGYTVRVTSRSPKTGDEEDEIERVQASLDAPGDWVAAVHGVETIVHLASAPFDRGADVTGTRYLLDAAQEAGVGHFVYMSIVGVDERDWFYYSAKRDCEALIEGSGMPFSILRATQFHDFVHLMLHDMFLRFPVGFLPTGWRLQPIDAAEVAAFLAEAVQRGPDGYLEDAGGPQILTMEELAEVWMEAAGRRRVLSLPFPILMGPAFSSGHNLAPDRRVGLLTWQEWVGQHVAPDSI